MKELWSQLRKVSILSVATAGLGGVLLAGCDGAADNSNSPGENRLTGDTTFNHLDFFSSPSNLLEGTDFFAFKAPIFMVEGNQLHGMLSVDFALADYDNSTNLALSFTLATEKADTEQSMKIEFMCGQEPCGQYDFQIAPNITHTNISVRVEPYFTGLSLNDITYAFISPLDSTYYVFSLIGGLWRNDLDEACNAHTLQFTGDVASDGIELFSEGEVINIIIDNSSNHSHSSAASNSTMGATAPNQLDGTLMLHNGNLPELDNYRAICAYN